ncbi:MAG: hypothetical protein ACTS4X_00580 [Candidatus Hodgkinia cicadicola]
MFYVSHWERPMKWPPDAFERNVARLRFVPVDGRKSALCRS